MGIRISARLVVAALIGVWFSLAGATASTTDVRAPAEPFTLESLSGEQVSLADYDNTVLLVNFWASWCPPCVAELPSMQALKESMSGEAFEILAINVGEDSRSVRGFIKHFGTPLEFPILLNADQGVIRDWKVNAMPTTALIDKQGRFAATVVGPRDWNSSDSRQLVRTLLDE